MGLCGGFLNFWDVKKGGRKMFKVIEVKTNKRNELVDITQKVQKVIDESGVKDGIIFLYVPHTTAGITVNENYDPSVRYDIENTLSKLVPPNAGYSHTEGNADSHIKTTIVGNSLFLFIENGVISFGTWQGIFLCEFDGPRTRKVWVKIYKEI